MLNVRYSWRYWGHGKIDLKIRRLHGVTSHKILILTVGVVAVWTLCLVLSHMSAQCLSLQLRAGPYNSPLFVAKTVLSLRHCRLVSGVGWWWGGVIWLTITLHKYCMSACREQPARCFLSSPPEALSLMCRLKVASIKTDRSHVLTARTVQPWRPTGVRVPHFTGNWNQNT